MDQIDDDIATQDLPGVHTLGEHNRGFLRFLPRDCDDQNLVCAVVVVVVNGLQRDEIRARRYPEDQQRLLKIISQILAIGVINRNYRKLKHPFSSTSSV